MKPAKPVVTVIDFPGVMTNVDPVDTPPGAAEVQLNLASVILGEACIRRGIRPVQFEDD